MAYSVCSAPLPISRDPFGPATDGCPRSHLPENGLSSTLNSWNIHAVIYTREEASPVELLTLGFQSLVDRYRVAGPFIKTCGRRGEATTTTATGALLPLLFSLRPPVVVDRGTDEIALSSGTSLPWSDNSRFMMLKQPGWEPPWIHG